MADWVDGRYVYGYDLSTGRCAQVHLRPVPQWQQGIFMAGGRADVSADDGDADLGEPDNLIADLRDGKSCRHGAAVPFDGRFPAGGRDRGGRSATDDLLVLANRGARIVLGMPRFYPGYDREIHEIYVYEGEIDEYARPLPRGFSIPCRKLRTQDSRASKFFSFSPI